MTKRLEALKSAKSSMDFFGNKDPKCPHCGIAFDISRNDAWELYDANDTHSVTCPSCEHDFDVTTHCAYSFGTDEQDDDGEQDESAAPPAAVMGDQQT